MILKSYEYTDKSLIYYIYKDELPEKADEKPELYDEEHAQLTHSAASIYIVMPAVKCSRHNLLNLCISTL